MAKLSLYSVPSGRLDEVTLSDGQLIFLTDRPGLFYDINSKRFTINPGRELIWISDNLEDLDSDTNITISELDGSILPYSRLDFVFVDIFNSTQIQVTLNGIPEGEGYSYINFNNIEVSKVYNKTLETSGNDIKVEIITASGTLSTNGTIQISNKQRLIEHISDGIITKTSEDISNENKLGLISVFGWR